MKRILPESVLQEDAKIKTGDELVAVNDLILYNSTEYATQALSNVEGIINTCRICNESLEIVSFGLECLLFVFLSSFFCCFCLSLLVHVVFCITIITALNFQRFF